LLIVDIASPWVPTSGVPVPAMTTAVMATAPPADDPKSERQEETATTPTLPATTSFSPAAATAVPDDAPSGFLCQHCQQYNVLRSSADTWYTVTAGRNVGVFRGW